MVALCGWTGFSPVEINSEHFIKYLAKDYSRETQLNFATAFGDDWGLESMNGVQCNSMYVDERLVVAIVGNPEFGRSYSLNNTKKLSQLPEIVAKAYLDSGSEFLAALSGPFLLAIYDKQKKETMLATDRVGRYSLFYHFNNGRLIFSTSLSAVVHNLIDGVDIDPQAIFNYLYFHVVPSPNTVYKNIFRIEPACCVQISKGNIFQKAYWSASFSNESKVVNVKNLKEEFIGLLRNSALSELNGEKNIGCFLSGGTDSSTVAGIVGMLTKDRPRTYSIGFDEPGFDEMEYARIAAKHFSTQHHEYYVTPNDVVDLVPAIVDIYGEPFGNSSVVPTYFCAKMAERDGISKMLGGDGGDELFGGNQRYATQILFSYYKTVPKKVRESLIEPLLYAGGFGDKAFPLRKLKRYVEQALIPMPERLESYNYLQMMGVGEVLKKDFAALIDVQAPLAHLCKIYESTNAKSIVNKMQILDLKITLSDNDLRKVTAMSNAAGVQIGYPLLSDELLAFSCQLPANCKVRGMKLRYFFKEALRDFLPFEIIKKKKHGFGLPFGTWLVKNSRLTQLAGDSLVDLKKRGIIDKKFIDGLLSERLKEHAHYYGGFVWILLILEQWYKWYESGTGKRC